MARQAHKASTRRRANSILFFLLITVEKNQCSFTLSSWRQDCHRTESLRFLHGIASTRNDHLKQTQNDGTFTLYNWCRQPDNYVPNFSSLQLFWPDPAEDKSNEWYVVAVAHKQSDRHANETSFLLSLAHNYLNIQTLKIYSVLHLRAENATILRHLAVLIISFYVTSKRRYLILFYFLIERKKIQRAATLSYAKCMQCNW